MMQTLIPAVDDELQYIVPKVFGMDKENWTELSVDEAVRTIVCAASSRFTVGLPLCRNEDYLKRTLAIIAGVMVTAIVGNLTPSILRPITARLASIPTWRNLAKIKAHLEPHYQERLAAMSKDADEQPQDQLQVMIRFAGKKRPEELHDTGIITTRLAATNFVSMHQTAGTAVQMILNIIDSDAEFGTVEKLREEAAQALATGPWTKEKLINLHGHDSVAHESMRVTFPFGNRGLLRMVMKDGIVTDNSVPLKKGTIMSWFASQAQMDPDKFQDATKFNPWRFSSSIWEKAEAQASSAAAQDQDNEKDKEVNGKEANGKKASAYHDNS